MTIFEKDIAIDMGTASTLLFEQGKGIVAREPTVVAVDKYNGKILKIGQEAQKMLGRTPANIVAIRPIDASVHLESVGLMPTGIIRLGPVIGAGNANALAPVDTAEPPAFFLAQR